VEGTEADFGAGQVLALRQRLHLSLVLAIYVRLVLFRRVGVCAYLLARSFLGKVKFRLDCKWHCHSVKVALQAKVVASRRRSQNLRSFVRLTFRLLVDLFAARRLQRRAPSVFLLIAQGLGGCPIVAEVDESETGRRSVFQNLFFGHSMP